MMLAIETQFIIERICLVLSTACHRENMLGIETQFVKENAWY